MVPVIGCDRTPKRDDYMAGYTGVQYIQGTATTVDWRKLWRLGWKIPACPLQSACNLWMASVMCGRNYVTSMVHVTSHDTVYVNSVSELTIL